MKEKRKCNFELMRIACMLLIIMSHYAEKVYLNNNELTSILISKFNINTIPLMIFGIWGSLGVSGFIAITSWFLVDSKKKIHSDKSISIAFKTWIYCLIILIIATIFKLETIDLKLLIKELLTPFYYNQYWFITCYCIFYLMIPIFQKTLEILSNKNLKKVCLTLIFIRVYKMLFGAISGQLLIFITIYYIVAYLKRNKNNFVDRHAFSGFICLCTLILILCIGANLLGTYLESNKLLKYVYDIRSCSNILVIFAGIFMLYIFKKININYNPIINLAAKSTMGVYILHGNIIFIGGGTTVLFNKILKANYFAHSPYLILILIGSSLLIFICCMLIDYFLDKFIVQPIQKTTKLDKKIGNLLDKYLIVTN